VGCHKVGSAQGSALTIVFDDLWDGELGVFVERLEGCALGFQKMFFVA
jgi:hypothetical protein